MPFSSADVSKIELFRTLPHGAGNIESMQIDPLDSVQSLAYRKQPEYALRSLVVFTVGANFELQQTTHSEELPRLSLVADVLPCASYSLDIAQGALHAFNEGDVVGSLSVDHVREQASKMPAITHLGASEKLGQAALLLKEKLDMKPAEVLDTIQMQNFQSVQPISYRAGNERILGFTQAQYESFVALGALLLHTAASEQL